VQIVLGGVTVLLGLSPLVSTVHLLTALSVLAGLITICAVPDAGEAQPRRAEQFGRPLTRAAARALATVGLAVLLTQLVLGGYVRHSGAGLACPDFPLCSGDVFPGTAGLGALGAPLARRASARLLPPLARASRRTALRAPAPRWPASRGPGDAGLLAVLLRLPHPVRATHAVVGYALWALLVWIRCGQARRARTSARLIIVRSTRLRLRLANY